MMGVAMRVLICGGRGFNDVEFLNKELDRLHGEYNFETVIHGAQIGADLLAGQWAADRGIAVEWYRAEWKKYLKAAGPLRNARMLAEGRPRLVIAFAGGKGTKDMVEKARAAGLEVIECKTAN
jgi:hypothetical protein